MLKSMLAPLVAGLLVTIGACNRTGNAQKAPNRFEIAVTEDGFKPDKIRVHQGHPVTLVFNRKTDVTCAKDIVIVVADQQKIEKTLPLNQPVEVAVTFPRAGTLSYACSMDMVKGQIFVQ